MLRQHKGRHRISTSGGGRTLGRAAGVLTIVALLVVGFASVGGATSRTNRYPSHWWGYPYGGGYHTTTTTGYHTTTSTTKATTTTTQATTTTTKATTTTTSTTTTTMPKGGEGCTPGYWRQAHHYDSWVGFSPDDDYETVFGVDASFTATLGQAVKFGGGGEFALARHAVAALLNSTSPGVDYALTTAQVINLVQQAYASGDFEDAKNVMAGENEEGCSLN